MRLGGSGVFLAKHTHYIAFDRLAKESSSLFLLEVHAALALSLCTCLLELNAHGYMRWPMQKEGT